MRAKPATKDAIKLFMEGAIALSKMETNGIKIDEDYLKQALDHTAQKIKRLEATLMADPIFAQWKRRFGSKTQLGSHKQLEEVIFDVLGHKRTGRKTKSGQHAADQSAFERVDVPFVKTYFECEKLKKARGTYLLGIQREVCDGYLHPIFNLHTVISFRSSSDRPNLQNMPLRNEEMGSVVRKCVIAPKGYCVGEIDLSGAEVAWSCNNHQDPRMISYLEDPKSDMHRDLAAQLFNLKTDDVSKMARFIAKNGFTFAQFYGSYYVDCAKSLWNQMDLLGIKTEKGIPLRKWLKRKGITKLGVCDPKVAPVIGSFEYHVREVEQDMWKNRFKVYNQWKWDHWNEYVEKGYFRTLTGFVIQGLLDRKQVCNFPIQGDAFHHLLWSCIELQKWLEKKKMKTKIVGEIHDSILLYFYEPEIDDVLHQANYIMTKKVRKHWPCIIVPIGIEAEVAPMGGSWYDKEKRRIH